MLLLLSICLYIGIHYIRKFGNIYIDIVFRTSLFLVLFLPMVYFSKVAPDLMQIVVNRLYIKLNKN